jgi:glycosyltransferase involved in cell wall biosynthesis
MKIEKRMEQNVLKYADALITNSSIMLNNFLSNNQDIDNLKNKFYVIPNGFDSCDFKKVINSTTKSEKFTITYTGAFYGRRKPDLFLQSVSELVKDGLLDKDNITIKFIGNFKIKVLANLINNLNLVDIVNIYPYMHHDEVINEMSASDCLLLIEGGGPGAEAFFTGKVFEYINIAKPILAVIPINGMAANLLRETKTGVISDCDDKEKTKENILFLYNNYKNNIGSISPDWDTINKYERRTLTKQLVKILEEN